MKFYDRESEQQLLKDVLDQSKREARMTVLMGRRRIGKTELSQDTMVAQTPELRKMTIHIGLLTKEDM